MEDEETALTYRIEFQDVSYGRAPVLISHISYLDASSPPPRETVRMDEYTESMRSLPEVENRTGWGDLSGARFAWKWVNKTGISRGTGLVAALRVWTEDGSVAFPVRSTRETACSTARKVFVNTAGEPFPVMTISWNDMRWVLREGGYYKTDAARARVVVHAHDPPLCWCEMVMEYRCISVPPLLKRIRVKIYRDSEHQLTGDFALSFIHPDGADAKERIILIFCLDLSSLYDDVVRSKQAERVSAANALMSIGL